jgi:acyl transferase domain-containing protein
METGRGAIIGMAGRFPKSGDLDELWRNLREDVVEIVPDRFVFRDALPTTSTDKIDYQRLKREA